ncbi:CC112 protein, partial [Alcedo cyanopectus]|nr:CC112 protein [Ceyx cyanopectus]
SRFTNVEKDRNRHLYNMRGDFRVEYSILEELERSMSISRKTERAKILQQLSKIQNNVEKVQQQLQDVKPTEKFINKLKEMMEEVENAINAFKEEQRQIYEQLLKEEKAAINELAVLERKVELWALINDSTTEKLLKLAKSRVSVDKTLENHLPKQVTEFERFPEWTGRWQGGWDDYDHQHFLKIQTRHKGKMSYVDEALEYLCGRTEEIEQHDKWHQEFIILHKRKKESVKKWKKQQQQEKDGNLKEKSEKILKEEWLQCEEAQKKNAEEGKRQVANEARKKQKAVAFAMEQPSQQKREETVKKQEKERQQRHHVKLLLEEDTLQKKEKEEPEKLEKKREEAEKEERKRTAAEKKKFQEH